MKPVDRYVLDSYALLAYFDGEPGASEVEGILEDCSAGSAEAWLSIINFGEVLYITERERGLFAAQKAVALVDQLPIRVVSAGRPQTFAAAHVKANVPLSYADAFAVALAQELDAQVVTADPEFAKVESLITVRWIASN